MRILKPLYVSPLVLPFDDGRRIHCVITAMLHVSFAGELLKEQELWFYANDETEGMVVDEGMPKPRGEWLVHGSCYARRPDVRQSFVKVTFAGREKVLAVFGPRTWEAAGPSAPEPFDVIPIRFKNAFGGPGFPENPTGTGLGGGPPPRVEVRRPFVTTPRDTPPVAGFGRVDPTWSQRMKRMGTYDQRWLETRYPGMAEDFDGSYFLLGLPDQWHDRHFDGTEAFSVVNMHPEREQLDGKLPGVTARAFVKKKGEDRMVDVRMVIDTVVFYPHRERLVVVCRGTTRTTSDTLADIEEAGFGVEWIDRPKSYEHYMQAFAVKRDRRAGMKRLDDTPLVPEGNPTAAPKQRIVAPGDGLGQRQMERRAEHQVAQLRKKLAEHELDPSTLDMIREHADTSPAEGMSKRADSILDKIPTRVDTSVDPDEIPPFDGPLPTVEGIIEQVNARIATGMEAGIAEARAKLAEVPGEEGERARAEFEKAAVELRKKHTGPPTFSRAKLRAELDQQLASLVEQQAMLGEHKVDVSAFAAKLEDPKFDKQLREFEAFQRESYRTTVQYQDPAPALDPEASAAARARALEMVKNDESFAYVDFTGADLSGLDLRGARLSRAFLESANLSGADLAGADLAGAVLARAKLAGTNLSKCKTLAGANLSEANLSEADLTGLDLTGCFFVKADLTGTKLVGTKLDKADFGKATLRGTDLSGSTATGLLFHKMRLEKVVLRGAKWERPLFYESEVVGIDARGAVIPKLAIVDTVVEDGVFDDATLLKLRAARALGTTVLRRCTFVGTVAHKAFFRSLDLTASDFRHADLKGSDFSEATLDDSDFRDARLVGARFMSASIRRCKFDRADLMEGLLGGALMDHASFESANLFRADFARSGGDGVSMQGANVKFVRTAPKREEVP